MGVARDPRVPRPHAILSFAERRFHNRIALIEEGRAFARLRVASATELPWSPDCRFDRRRSGWVK